MISNHVLVAEYFRIDELKMTKKSEYFFYAENVIRPKKRENSLSEKPHTVFSCALRKKVISSCSSKAKVALSFFLTGKNVGICQKGNSGIDYCYTL